MNEKIKGFIEQAHIYSFQENRGKIVCDDFAEKFAELIIKECILLSYDEATRFYNMDEDELASVMENFGELLKKHFEVLENTKND